MMVLENSGVKPFILPFVEVALQTFLANGIEDLGYSSPIDKTQENIARNKLFRGENAEIDTKQLRIEYKVRLLAAVFQRITGSPPEITIHQWNFFAYVIQKYMLLAHLFLKAGPIEPRLQRRRGSMNARGSKCLHGCLRQTIGAHGCGASDHAIEEVLISFSKLLLFITKGQFTIVSFEGKGTPLPKRGSWKAPFPNTWKNTAGVDKTEGYYIVMKHSPFIGHVISLYTCEGRWTLFDNQAEIVPLDSARISAVGIKGIDYTIHKNDVQYTITYGDDTTEIITTPLDVEQSGLSEYKFSKGASYKLVRMAAAGGRRRNKTHRRKKRNNRSKRR
jgi:hypothetical protein